MFSAEEEAGSEEADAEMESAERLAGVGLDGKPVKARKRQKVASKRVGSSIKPAISSAGKRYPVRKPVEPVITSGRFDALAEDPLPRPDPGDGWGGSLDDQQLDPLPTQVSIAASVVEVLPIDEIGVDLSLATPAAVAVSGDGAVHSSSE